MEAKNKCTVRITLVDDNAIFRLIFSNMLSSFSLCPLEIRTFDNALEFLDQFPCPQGDAIATDILFVDINMPFMTGWELMDKLETDVTDFTQSSAIYIISSSSSKSDLEQVKNYSFIKGYVLKPVNKQVLFDIIKKHIAVDSL
ncbi:MULTISPECIES: response regulator [Sphingobacterium]|nr:MULTISPECIES: response regulator [unclassified Sphingobacterium]